jgi:hypothetical protein
MQADHVHVHERVHVNAHVDAHDKTTPAVILMIGTVDVNVDVDVTRARGRDRLFWHPFRINPITQNKFSPSCLRLLLHLRCSQAPKA